MPDIDLVAVLVATAVAFVASAVYYALLSSRAARVDDGPPPVPRPAAVLAVGEVARSLVVALVVAGLASRADIEGWDGGLVLGLVLWIGFPLVLWAGAILHERTPLGLATLHGGDWLIKLGAVGVIVGALQ